MGIWSTPAAAPSSYPCLSIRHRGTDESPVALLDWRPSREYQDRVYAAHDVVIVIDDYIVRYSSLQAHYPLVLFLHNCLRGFRGGGGVPLCMSLRPILHQPLHLTAHSLVPRPLLSAILYINQSVNQYKNIYNI